MKTKFTLFIALSAFFMLTSCLKDDAVRVAEEAKLNAEFDFATTQEYELRVKTVDRIQTPMENIVIEVYSQNPFTLNEDSIEVYVGAPIMAKGITDSDGSFYMKSSLPTHLEEFYVYIDHIGLPQLHKVEVFGNSLMMLVGAMDENSDKRIDSNLLSQSIETKSVSAVNEHVDLTLGDWNVWGHPQYLVDPDVVTEEVLEKITASLPEKARVPLARPELLDNMYESNLVLVEKCEVFVTFVHEGAGWKNTLGYYVYPTDNPPTSPEDIENYTVIFPNVSYDGSGGTLLTGDKVQLKYYNEKSGEFEEFFPAGVTVGWYLKAYSWADYSGVGSGSYIHYSNFEWNIEKELDDRKHHVLIYDDEADVIYMGFEDVNRDYASCDEDFNDAMFYASVTPPDAVYKENLKVVEIPDDTDEDGVPDHNDDFPEDPNKAFSNMYPSDLDYGSLLFEDLWPNKGDYDFNDEVIDYQINQITNGENKVTAIEAKFKLRASGSGYSNGFAFQLDLSPSDIESVSGVDMLDNYISLNDNGTEANQRKAVIVVFDNCSKQFSGTGAGTFVNTVLADPTVEPVEVTVLVELKSAKAISAVGLPPYNPFLIVNSDRSREIHLPNHIPTDLADYNWFGTGDDDSNPIESEYYTAEGHLPWCMNIPVSVKYPQERNDITKAFSFFVPWANSQGYSYMDWYLDKSGYRNNSFLYDK